MTESNAVTLGTNGPPLADWAREYVADAEAEGESYASGPLPSSVLPCGCHLRRPDYETILCDWHDHECFGEPSR